jgi:hypothetical protein
MGNLLLTSSLSLLAKTLRITGEGEPLPERCVVAFWHSRMIGGWWAARKDALALVSKSSDGEKLSDLLTKWKYKLVRGSSLRDGKEALNEAIEMIKDGEAKRLVITPDGPRGPREEFKRGAFIAAQELAIPLVFLHINYLNKLKLAKSWDRFEIPYPFSQVKINVEHIDISSFPVEVEAQKEWLVEVSEQYKTISLK